MDKLESLNHTKWHCKYHMVFILKGRRKVLYGQLRAHLGEVLRGLAQHKESRIEEGHLMPGHVHMMIAIPPKYSVSNVVGYIKGKSASHLARPSSTIGCKLLIQKKKKLPLQMTHLNEIKHLQRLVSNSGARVYSERKRNFAGQSFWARGYFVSTVGRDEELIRNYIRAQEREDERLGLWRQASP